MKTKTKIAAFLATPVLSIAAAVPALAQSTQGEVNDLSGYNITTGLFSAQHLMIAALIALVAWRFLRRGAAV